MGRKRKTRRRSHGSAWHWQQTDCWYYTMPGTKKRLPLFDEQGARIRGKENGEAAQIALAREKLTWESPGTTSVSGHAEWLVAGVCSEYLQYCERGVARGTISKGHLASAVSWLNDLCRYCGKRPVVKLNKSHIQDWVDSHPTWRSPATRRGVLAVVVAAFNRAAEMYQVANPLKGMKKPRSEPRLQSFTQEEEQALYSATEERFRDFLFTAIHTGLRPFCELACVTADDVEETERGMLWRVYSSKTKKTRKIPVRPEVAAMVRKLMRTAPRGSGVPLFRNTKGQPWKRMTGVVRFIAIREKLGWNEHPARKRYSCYTCRHTFAHRMLSGYWNDGAGCSIETLAELIGDTPKVAFDHYGKEWGQHYQDPLWAAIGERSPSNTGTTAQSSKEKKTKRKSAAKSIPRKRRPR